PAAVAADKPFSDARFNAERLSPDLSQSQVKEVLQTERLMIGVLKKLTDEGVTTEEGKSPSRSVLSDGLLHTVAKLPYRDQKRFFEESKRSNNGHALLADQLDNIPLLPIYAPKHKPLSLAAVEEKNADARDLLKVLANGPSS